MDAWVIDNLKPVHRELGSSIRELLRRAIVCKLASVSLDTLGVSQKVSRSGLFFSVPFKDQ